MSSFDVLRSDGGSGWPEGGLPLQEIKTELSDLAQESSVIWGHRLVTDATRLCKWDGQSEDGLKHEVDGLTPEPFDGACDQRVRLADMLVNDDVALLISAAMRARMKFTGVTEEDTAKAGKLTTLMRYVISNIWGLDWIRELTKVANYYLSDTPAVGLLKIWWRREYSVRLTRITEDDLMQRVIELESMRLAADGIERENAEPQIEQAASDFMTGLEMARAGADDYLKSLLSEMFADVSAKRIKRMIRELTENGVAEFPEKYIQVDSPAIEAKRIWEDWYIPRNTSEFQEARVYFESDWLTKAQVVERKTSEGWSEKFVEAVIGKDGEGGHEGEPAIPEYVRDQINGNLKKHDVNAYRGLYNIITAYFQAVNEDGIPGRYYVVLHKDVDVPAKEPELINYAHGLYPGHCFQREVISNRLLDARGIAALAAPYQGLMKLYCDSFGDNAQLSGVPPMVTRGRARMGALRIRPLAELPAKRDGDYAWLRPPEYPQQVVNMIQELRRQVDEYFGRENQAIPATQAQLARGFKVLWWLANLREVLTQVFKLIQQFMPDEIIQRITNARGEQLFADGREEIQGQFDLELNFDPADLDVEGLSQKGSLLRDLVLAMDKSQQVDSGPIVEDFLYRLAPNVASAAFKAREQAVEDEIKDEESCYQQIRGGLEPPMPDDGSINYEARLGFYQQIQEKNPDIFKDMSPDKVAILQSRIQRLQFLSKQFGENAMIGRQGGLPALQKAQGTEGGGIEEAEGLMQ